ncbi:hypothetical protein RY831_10085 [Noviherbaspirillum sp. CPCC 100848]|uniref:Uncharacterized protein n=1 Tax=Noviherbaspirillum album TaxID=3080276 RepID=A0ABU6J7B6_9BURK|nr:hypothetical protein [Noviherbaspirillum sp. CPCC 100848]MEC4719501.1 hypothetical protein [Noviherbaspirillum sp. CPCC 100848]
MTPADIMKIIRTYEASSDTSWTTMVREHAKCLASVSDRLNPQEMEKLVEIAAASYHKAKNEYQASVEYDLLVLRLNAQMEKRQQSK